MLAQHMAAQAQTRDVRYADEGLASGATVLRWTVRACALVLLVGSMWVVYRIVDGSTAQGSGIRAPAARVADGRQAALADLARLEGRILSARVNGSARLPALTESYVRAIAAAEPAIGRIEARARLAAEAKVVERRCPSCAKTLRSVRLSLG